MIGLLVAVLLVACVVSRQPTFANAATRPRGEGALIAPWRVPLTLTLSPLKGERGYARDGYSAVERFRHRALHPNQGERKSPGLKRPRNLPRHRCEAPADRQDCLSSTSHLQVEDRQSCLSSRVPRSERLPVAVLPGIAKTHEQPTRKCGRALRQMQSAFPAAVPPIDHPGICGLEAESSMTQVESSIIRIEPSIIRIEPSIIRIESSIAQVESSVVWIESSIVRIESSATRVESSATRDESSITRVEPSATRDESSTTQVESSIARAEASIVRIGSSIVRIGSSIVRVEQTDGQDCLSST